MKIKPKIYRGKKKDGTIVEGQLLVTRNVDRYGNVTQKAWLVQYASSTGGFVALGSKHVIVELLDQKNQED